MSTIPPDDVRQRVDAIYRSDGRRIFATLVRLLREAGRTLSLRLGYHGQALTAGAAAPKRGRRPKAAPESA